MRNLILLHGALGGADTLQPLADGLKDAFNVHVYEFSGHGRRSGEGDNFSIDGFSLELQEYIRDAGLNKPFVFGYSMGGYVAAALEAARPGMFAAIAALATKWTWTPEIAAKETGMLNGDVIAHKAPKFAAALAGRHGESWKTVLAKTAAMMTAMGAAPPVPPENLSALALPVLLCLGDSDKMVSLSETLDVRAAVAGSQLCLLPGTPHPLEFVPVEILAAILKRFFAGAAG